MKKSPITLQVLTDSDISCRSGARPTSNGKEIQPASELYYPLNIPINLKAHQLSKLRKDAHRMNNARPAGRPSVKKEAASAAAAKKLREDGYTWRAIEKELTSPKYTNRSADGWRKLVARYSPGTK